MKIFVIGGASLDTIVHIDKFPKSEGTVFAKDSYEVVGSTGVGKAIALAKLGFDVTFHFLVGEDRYSSKIIQRLREEKIKQIYDYDVLPTERHLNLMDNTGKRISIFLNSSTFEPEVNDKQIYQNIDQADLVVLNIQNYARNFLEYVKKTNKPLWIDIHDYDGFNPYHQDFIKAADVIMFSMDKIKDPIKYMESLIKDGKKYVIASDGAKGSYIIDNKKVVHYQKALDLTELVDTNGAGDHLFSGVLYGLVNGYTNEESLYMGAYLAKLCIESKDISNNLINEDLIKNL